MNINTGISETQRATIAQNLSKLLADSYTLYLKTQNFHWNVTGPMFQTLHVLFEEHYTELAAAVDEVAERIRALGHTAPGSYRQFSELSSIQETVEVPNAEAMVEQLLEGHEAVIRTARSIVSIAEEGGDQVSADLCIGRIAVHEKAAWMLRSLAS